MKILSIDDDLDFNLALKKILSSEDHEVLTTDHQSEFFDHMVSFEPDLCLVDFNLTYRGEGLDIIKKIKAIGDYYLPIIALSRLDDNEIIQQLFEIGADDFVSKPLDEYILKNKIALATGLNSRDNFGFETDVPADYQTAKIKVYFELKEITVKGILVESDSYISSGTTIRLQHQAFLPSGSDILNLRIKKVTKRGSRFQMFLPFLPQQNIYKMIVAEKIKKEYSDLF